MQYTRLEAANILSTTAKQSKARGNMTRDMINAGYVPTSTTVGAAIKYLGRLMLKKDKGKTIDDNPWPSTTSPKSNCRCHGIQSMRVSDFALSSSIPGAFKYCVDLGWTLQNGTIVVHKGYILTE